MCPLVATRGGAPWFALGASGGRRILAAVFQLTAFLVDCGLSVEAAAAQPRLNVDGVLPLTEVEALVQPNHYANPVIAGHEDGTAFGAAQLRSPVSGAVGAR